MEAARSKDEIAFTRLFAIDMAELTRSGRSTHHWAKSDSDACHPFSTPSSTCSFRFENGRNCGTRFRLISEVNIGLNRFHQLPTDLKHHSKARGLRTNFETRQRYGFVHSQKLRNHPALLMQRCSVKTRGSLQTGASSLRRPLDFRSAHNPCGISAEAARRLARISSTP